MQQTAKPAFWQTFATPQFMQMISALEDGKKNGSTKMLIGETGVGKTYAIRKFAEKMPENTFVITVSDVYLLEDIIQELCELLGVSRFNSATGLPMASYSKKTRLDKIVDKLIKMKLDGGKPILIFDEAENMNISVLKSIKGLYDRLKDHCSIVLVGTPRLIDRILNTNGKNKGRYRANLPELYGRFKAGLRYILPVTTEHFQPILNKYVTDASLKNFIAKTLDSYRDLNTHLEPVMREAQERNKPLNVTLYKLYHEINY